MIWRARVRKNPLSLSFTGTRSDTFRNSSNRTKDIIATSREISIFVSYHIGQSHHKAMGANNSSNRLIAQQETTNDDKLSAPNKPGSVQDDQLKATLGQKKRRQQSHKGATNVQSKKARKICKAREGIRTGPDFVVPFELVKLRRGSLYQSLPAFIDREELDRSIEQQIVEDGCEDDDLVDTWTYYNEEVWGYLACPCDEGFGANNV